MTTTSKASSANGSSETGPTRRSASGTRVRASVIAAAPTSIPETDAGAPRSSAKRRKPPVPQPASRTRWPGRVRCSPRSVALSSRIPRCHQCSTSTAKMLS